MKKIVTAAAMLLLPVAMYAQPWMPRTNTPVKLADIIQAYEKANPDHNRVMEKEENGKVEKEDKDYQFQRWAWYYKNHLDENGYIVSPMRMYANWDNYLQAAGNKANKTTGANNTPNWVFQGPDTSSGGYAGVGRINAIGFHPADPNTFIIGAAGGGAWRTTNGGHTWLPLYNIMATLGVSDIDYNPHNPNTIFICTGDRDGGDNYSVGVLKSVDGGNTFTTLNPTWNPSLYYTANCLAISAADTNTMMLASNQGIYKTTDGGATWTQEVSGDIKQVVYNTSNANIIYATGYIWNINGNDAEIYRSTNGGITWTALTTVSNSNRVAIAVTPQNPNIIQALFSNSSDNGLNSIYTSVNGGTTFTPTFIGDPNCTNNMLGWDNGLPTSGCGGQGWYDLCIAINPTNSNEVVIGGVNTYYSENAGISWDIATQWYSGNQGVPTAHADKHFLGYNPAAPTTLYEGCDGGIYKTTDIANTWTDLTNGLGITQFYSNAVDNGVPYVMGGAQDNGTKMVNNGAYIDIAGGDGMDCLIDYFDPTNIWYVSYPSGSIDRTVDGGINYTNISSNIPTQPSGDWVTPYIMHPNINSVLLAGYDQLYYTADQGDTWSSISPQLNPGNNINHIAISRKNPNYIYMVYDNYNNNQNTLFYSPDFGGTWNNINITLGNESISDLAVDPKDEKKLWVTLSGYGAYKAALYNVATNTWTSENGNLPDVPMNCIVIDSMTRTMYIGSSTAVFYRDTTMTNWALYNTGLPSAEVEALNINYTTGELWAATFGRGMWKTIKHETPAGIKNITANHDVISVAPNPNNGSFTITSADKGLAGKTVMVKILSMEGKAVWQRQAQFDGNSKLKITTTGLPKGTYNCQLTGKGIQATTSVIIL